MSLDYEGLLSQIDKILNDQVFEQRRFLEFVDCLIDCRDDDVDFLAGYINNQKTKYNHDIRVDSSVIFRLNRNARAELSRWGKIFDSYEYSDDIHFSITELLLAFRALDGFKPRKARFDGYSNEDVLEMIRLECFLGLKELILPRLSYAFSDVIEALGELDLLRCRYFKGTKDMVRWIAECSNISHVDYTGSHFDFDAICLSGNSVDSWCFNECTFDGDPSRMILNIIGFGVDSLDISFVDDIESPSSLRDIFVSMGKSEGRRFSMCGNNVNNDFLEVVSKIEHKGELEFLSISGSYYVDGASVESLAKIVNDMHINKLDLSYTQIEGYDLLRLINMCEDCVFEF